VITLLNPPDTVLVMVLVPALPCTMVSAAGLAESVKPGVAPLVIVRLIEVVSISPPPVPLTVTVDVPTAAELPAVSVNVEDPAPPEMLAGLKLAVTPVGNPLADRATALLNPPVTVLVIVDVPAVLCFTLNEAGLAESVKPGATPLVTVKLTEVLSVSPPPVPVTVTADVPTVAELLAVSVKVEDPAPPEMLPG
jgi:hypothetical protein